MGKLHFVIMIFIFLLSFCTPKQQQKPDEDLCAAPDFSFVISPKHSDSINCFVMKFLDEICINEGCKPDTFIRIYFTKRFENAYILTINKSKHNDCFNTYVKTFPEQYGNPVYLINYFKSDPVHYSVVKKKHTQNIGFELQDLIRYVKNNCYIEPENIDGGVCIVEISINGEYSKMKKNFPLEEDLKKILQNVIEKLHPEQPYLF